MKKVSLVALATALTMTSAVYAGGDPCKQAFQGFYISGNLGYAVGKGNRRFHHQSTNFTVKNRNHIGFNGVDGGIGTGWNHRLCNWVLGIGFDANWANTRGRHRDFAFRRDPVTRITRTESFRHNVRMRNSLDLYGRLGYVVCAQAMPFIALGWENASWKQRVRGQVVTTTAAGATTTATFQRSRSKRLNSLLWKLGVDFIATKHVIVGFEWTGTSAGSSSFNHHHRQTGDRHRGHFRPQNNKFALTAKVIY